MKNPKIIQIALTHGGSMYGLDEEGNLYLQVKPEGEQLEWRMSLSNDHHRKGVRD